LNTPATTIESGVFNTPLHDEFSLKIKNSAIL
jgi:hypothetical protein